MSNKIKPIAIYLPQFHPIPENNEWWGKGFTEWSNVVTGKPLFKNHYQPHLPADLGFYDLRLHEVRIEQARLAKENGIYGFCYYHYWFNGKRVLNKTLDDMLATNIPDFPFMYCWANENWTRTWDGFEKNVLLEQNYNIDDHRRHMEWLCTEVFSHQNYIKIAGKPVFVVYRNDCIPEMKKVVAIWQAIAKEKGFPGIYLMHCENSRFRILDLDKEGFDAALQFQPYLSSIPQRKAQWYRRVIRKLTNNHLCKWQNDRIIPVVDYEKVVEAMTGEPLPKHKRYPGIMPGWDNTARRKDGRAFVIHGSTPDLYKKWLKHITVTFKPFSKEENFIFINAWNEWAEGNHLEPCLKWGNQYLEATKNIILNEGQNNTSI